MASFSFYSLFGRRHRRHFLVPTAPTRSSPPLLLLLFLLSLFIIVTRYIARSLQRARDRFRLTVNPRSEMMARVAKRLTRSSSSTSSSSTSSSSSSSTATFGLYPTTLFSPLLPFYLNRWLNLLLLLAKRVLLRPKLHVERLTMPDGGRVTVEWLDTENQRRLPSDAPLLLVLPTLCGRGDECGPWIATADWRGWRVAVFGRRGHSEPLATAKFNMMGDAEDAHRQAEYAVRKFPDASNVAMAGLSAGSGLLLTYLGRFADETPVKMAACLCPAYDMGIFEKLDDKAPSLARFMLRSLQRTFIHGNESVLEASDSKRSQTLASTKSLGEFFRAHVGFSADDIEDVESWREKSDPNVHFVKA